METPRELDVHEGDLIADKYKVERVLGIGGMGAVVLALHENLGQQVAIKILLREARSNPEACARFLREARSAVRIHNEHVARVTDVGTLASGAPYMVMEYLVGRDLAQLVADAGQLPVSEAVDYVLQACEAIAEAHSLGIVHRDLKPSNLFLSRHSDGTALVKVLDFGISKSTTMAKDQASLTSVSSVMGSPGYMSPEQLRSSKNVDARTDIWALAVILYELLTGKHVFESDSLTGLVAMISLDPAMPMRTHRPDLPEALDAVVLKCLEKEPAFRPTDVAELAKLLVPFAPQGAHVSAERAVRLIRGSMADQPSSSAQAAIDIAMAATARQPAASATQASWTSSSGNSRRRTTMLLVVLGVVIMAAAVIVVFTLRSTPGRGATQAIMAAPSSESRTTASAMLGAEAISATASASSSATAAPAPSSSAPVQSPDNPHSATVLPSTVLPSTVPPSSAKPPSVPDTSHAPVHPVIGKPPVKKGGAVDPLAEP